MFLEVAGQSLLGLFREQCTQYLPDFNWKEFDKAVDIINRYENSPVDEIIQQSPYVKKWYASLKKGEPDYSVYEGEYYMASSLLCYANYTRGMLRMLAKHTDVFKDKKIDTIVDYGCGIGYSSLVLQEMWPDAKVYGTNYNPSLQLDFTKKLFKPKGLYARDRHTKIGKVSLGFSAEYFEHFEEPVTELITILDKNSPDVLVTANSFAPLAVGHFNKYNVTGVGMGIDPRKTTNAFNKTMHNNGYIKYSHWWNGRPNIWVKQN